MVYPPYGFKFFFFYDKLVIKGIECDIWNLKHLKMVRKQLSFVKIFFIGYFTRT